MKKNTLILSILMLIFFNFGNATATVKVKKTKEEKKAERQIKKEEKKAAKELKKTESRNKKADSKFRREMKKYELEAVIKTNKGNISLFLYPEASPLNVANFVYLAKNNFYNGLKFHRVIPNVLIQSGDPLGTGLGSTGYTLDDEFPDWLNFENSGMLAMANSGPNTNSSQFFLTVTSLPQLNGKYTIIGETVSREDLSVIRVIRQDDVINDIEIKGKKVDEFLNNFTEETQQWDAVLKGN